MKIGSNLGFIALPVHATQSDFELKKSKTHSFRALKWLYLLHFDRQIFVASTRQLLPIIIFTSSSPRPTSSRSESKFSWRYLKQHAAGRDTAKMVPFSI